MNNAISLIKQNKSYSYCFPNYISNYDPKAIAKNIVDMQYQGRYCPRSMQSRVKGWCNQIKYFPVPDKKRDKMLQIMLATCTIAKERMQNEADKAHKKYGTLSFDDYYARYVAPLIPKYKKLLADSKNHYGQIYTCNPNSLRLVRFRDPDVDAQTAAYEKYSVTLCHQYFKGKASPFAKFQQSVYVMRQAEKK